MKIIFFGSDDFAALHLETLLKEGYDILACVTGPDKPQGRGMKIVLSPIKEIAIKQKLPCLQPPTLKDKNVVEELKSYKADLFVVVAYGRLLTQEILDIPKFLCMNVHGSLLPEYRGAAPINWSILNGNQETGVTIQKMALALDSGAIIAQESMIIGDDENASQLRERMAQEGAKLLARVLNDYPVGDFPLTLQDEARVTYAPKLTKDMGKIDWSKEAHGILNQVRGLQPWPGAYTFFNGKMLKILQATMSTLPTENLKPGQVVAIDKTGFHVACKGKAILIKEVHPEAGKAMAASSFIAGYKISQGFIFVV